MSKELNPQENQHLEFEEATNLTIEEAVQKEADLAAGVTEQDNVLDKYIKRNPEKVGEQKFVNKDKVRDLSGMDTSSLDQFIQKQRQDLEDTGVLPVLIPQVAEKEVTGTLAPAASPFDGLATEEVSQEHFYEDNFLDKGPKRRRKLVVGSLAALLLGTVALAYGLNALNDSASLTKASSSAPSASSKASTSTSAAVADVQAFEDLYKTFFADEALTKPKNSEFGNLPILESALNKLKNTSDYEAAKGKYDSLKKAISAISALNDKFETPAIVDGEKMEAKLKEGASLDDLSTNVLNTGKASLDTLLQAVITEARGLSAGGSITGGTATKTAPSSQEATPASSSTAAAATPTTPATSPVTTTTYGITSYDPGKLQRHLSRVPFNEALIADKANPAWTFNPGVIEEIIRVSQQRGYISGYDFILEPVNIVNGNGYYNMYRPDGTYLFSINAKTGYFVGNGSGYADALDY